MTWWLSTAALGCLLLAEQVTMSSKKDLTTKTEGICTSSPSSSLNLMCETGEMLHVISVRYQNMTPSCESPPGASCVFLQETQADSLYTDCNGVATCQMEVQKFWMDTVCGETATYQAVISYECVSGSTTLTLTCNDGPSPVLSSTRLTQVSSDSPATTSATSRRPLQEVTECRDSERTLTLVSSVCGVAILFLLVVIVAIIVYFKAITPSRNTAVVPDQTEEPMYSQLGHVGQSGDHTESARPYSGLMETTYSTVFSTEQSLVVCSDHVHYTSIQDVHGYAKVNIYT